MTERITAWSFNRLMNFETCPYRSYLEVIKKTEQPELTDKHPMVRGRRIHEEIEQYIRGEVDEVNSVKSLRSELDFCRESYAAGDASVEERWGFDQDWQPVDFFDPQVWVRVVEDAFVRPEADVGIIYDWKTGKSFGNEVKHTQQGQLYAISTFLKFPELNTLDVVFGYTDEGKVTRKTYERDAKFLRLMRRWTERGLRMTTCVDFTPKPNVYNCKWCPFGPNGTKACIYGVEGL